MGAVKRNPLFTLSGIFKLLTVVMLLSGCGLTPYKSKFQCPPTYMGLCESMSDAYEDSVNNIDPRKFDPKWQKARKKWEKKNAALVQARKERKRREIDGEAPGYRQSLFKELRGLIDEPETPILVPPKIGRVLILGYTGDGKIYVAPHYVYYKLDDAKWILRKIPERYVPRKRKIKKKAELKSAASQGGGGRK